MSLLNNLKRYLYGTPGMTSIDTGDVPATGQGSQGLIGIGGEYGGGLLQDNFNQMNNAEGGLLENIPQGALLGAALYGQGLKGKDPLAGAFPASGTPEYAAALQSYLFKGKENTLGKEALSLYNESLTVDNFENWYKKLPSNKRQLWDKYIKGNESMFGDMFKFPVPGDTDIKTPDLPKLEITEEMIQATINANGGNISRNDAIKAIEAAYKKNPENFM